MTSVVEEGAKEGDTKRNAEHRNTMKAIADPLKAAVKELKRIDEAVNKDSDKNIFNSTLLEKQTNQSKVVNTLRDKYTKAERETQSKKKNEADNRNWYKSLNGKELRLL